ncbi:MAG: hypothetical protein IJ468_12420 [Lachnospiraceae bacterium]|nr:hypothetical protein [Lachnospiraceae bacterium]
MTQKARYSQIDKFLIQVTCTQPLHTGSANGGVEEVLIHPVEEEPFLQASSLAGAFRGYYENAYGKGYAAKIFGSSGSEQQEESRIRFSDGRFDMKTVKMELRPRIRIDAATGTVGSEQQSGQKFEIQYVAAGAEMKFTVYALDWNKEDKERFLTCLGDIHSGYVQFGGQKSNGCGYFAMKAIAHRHYSLTDSKDREAWFCEDEGMDSEAVPILPDRLPVSLKFRAFDLNVYGETDGELLVKGIAVTDYGKNAPDVMNIQNGNNDYIIPGSSVKGAIRSRMKMICSHLDIKESFIDSVFGAAATETAQGKMGILRFYDVIVGDQEANDQAELRRRIHVDKFTGGVMDSALFSEKNVSGSVMFHAGVLEGEHSAAACALLAFVFRDMAERQMTLGSGCSVGKGYVKIHRLEIVDRAGNLCELDFQEKKVNDDSGLLRRCMNELKNRKEQRDGI